MIINTGCRTDIPAFYSKWFYQRIKEGFVYVRNPYNEHQISSYRLDPEVVDCLAFCTKNPAPMLSRLEEIRQFSQFWFVTITPYGKDIEPNVPSKEVVMKSFQELSEKVGINRIAWRYDPIFLNEQYPLERHLSEFEQMAKTLSGYTKVCVISFIDLYEKTKRNFPGVRPVTKEQRLQIGKEFVRIGRSYGITIKSCAENTELEPYGVDCAGCMTQEVIEQAIGTTLLVPKQKGIREGCDCLLGHDIGRYNTCNHGCIYCYANYSMDLVKAQMQRHNPNSPLLIGEVEADDQVKEAKQISYIDGQLRLF